METEETRYDELDEPQFSIDLKAHLELADFGYGNYYIMYQGKIYSSDGYLDPATHDVFGNIDFFLLLFGQSERCRMSGEEFEKEQFSRFQGIFDSEIMRLSPAFKASLPPTVTNPNILMINRFDIHYTHRKLDIGKKVLRLLLHTFKDSCGLFLVDVQPFQHTIRFETEARLKGDHIEKMRYDTFTPDPEQGFYKLMNYFSKLGFRTATGFDERVAYLDVAAATVSPADFHIT